MILTARRPSSLVGTAIVVRGGVGVGCHFYVVEADDGDVVGNRESALAQCFHYAERDRVVAAENGRGHGLSVDELEHAGISVGGCQQGVDDIIFIAFYARLVQRVQVSLVSVFVEDLVFLLCRTDIADFLVSEAYEVLDRTDRARITIAEHFVEIASDAVHSRVYKIRYLVLSRVMFSRLVLPSMMPQSRCVDSMKAGKPLSTMFMTNSLYSRWSPIRASVFWSPREQRRKERRYECLGGWR